MKIRRIIAAAAAGITLACGFGASAQAAIYDGPNGPKNVSGANEALWLAHGKSIGRPLTDELPARTQGGRYNYFERGAIYWTQGTWSHTVKDSFYNNWAAQGWETGYMGYPMTEELPAANGGVYQQYQGTMQYWSPRTGAHTINGQMFEAWADRNWERGFLGFPTSEVGVAASGGTFQRFAGGALYDQANPYIDPVAITGAFYGYWAARGSERGYLGWPIDDEYGLGSGGDRIVVQYFDNGTLYWTQGTGVTEYYPTEDY